MRSDKLAHLEELMIKCARKLEEELAVGPHDMGLSSAQFLMLRLVGRYEPTTVSEVAEALDVTPSAITSLSDRLVRAGFLSPTRKESDRRVVVLTLTPQGRETLDELLKTRRLRLASYLEQFSQEDLSALIRVVERLASVMGIAHQNNP